MGYSMNEEAKIFRIELVATIAQKYALLGKCEELGIKITNDREYRPKPGAGEHFRKPAGSNPGLTDKIG
jgi:hypothetical protein